jgi:predicted acetyltransferase
VAGGPGEIAGYASYFLESTGGNGYRVACKHLVAVTAPALTALLGYFRRFENAAAEIAWFGPPSGGPAGLALATSTFALQPTLNRWMGRILDVPRALEGRGYPDVSGELVVERAPGSCAPLEGRSPSPPRPILHRQRPDRCR